MSAATAEFAALVERVDGHDEQLAQVTAQFTVLFDLVKAANEHEGVSPDVQGHRIRPRHLRLVRGGQS